MYSISWNKLNGYISSHSLNSVVELSRGKQSLNTVVNEKKKDRELLFVWFLSFLQKPTFLLPMRRFGLVLLFLVLMHDWVMDKKREM